MAEEFPKRVAHGTFEKAVNALVAVNDVSGAKVVVLTGAQFDKVIKVRTVGIIGWGLQWDRCKVFEM